MLFSLYNLKTNVFNRLIEVETREQAIKMFVELLNSPQPNEITNYIDEYVLMQLGDFDRVTGMFNIEPAPVSIITGLECVKLWKERRKFLDEIFTPSRAGDEATKESEVVCQ